MQRADSIQRFILLSAPGLSRIVEREIYQRGIKTDDHKIVWLRSHDVLFVSGELNILHQLLKLRTVEDIFIALAEEVPIVTKHDLKKLTPRFLREKVIDALPLMPPRRQKRPTTHFGVFVKADEDQQVYRKEIENTLSAFLLTQFGKWKYSDPADVEFWAFYIKKHVSVGLRLTRPSFKQRKYRVEERPGSLRPTVAAALVALSEPEDSDYILDPMCGSGTILLERALWGKSQTIIGCDVDRDAISIAEESAKKADVVIDFQSSDSIRAGALAQHAGKVSKLISNLPFNKQFEDDDFDKLYKKAIQLWKPLLTADGEMILLTPHDDLLKNAAAAQKLAIRPIAKVRIKGLAARVFKISREARFSAKK